MSGQFVTFEGGEGAGKTTQIKKLASFLEGLGHDVVVTREPGGTDEAEAVRNLVVQRDGGNWEALSEVLLFSAARHEHVEKLIKPALTKGKTVICDRFVDSTIAYQGYGRGLSLDLIRTIDDIARTGVMPKLTFILDIEPREGLARSNERLAGDTEDRFERLDVTFHEKLRAGFLAIAAQEPDRCRVLDASQDIDIIFNEIRNEFI